MFLLCFVFFCFVLLFLFCCCCVVISIFLLLIIIFYYYFSSDQRATKIILFVCCFLLLLYFFRDNCDCYIIPTTVNDLNFYKHSRHTHKKVYIRLFVLLIWIWAFGPLEQWCSRRLWALRQGRFVTGWTSSFRPLIWTLRQSWKSKVHFCSLALGQWAGRFTIIAKWRTLRNKCCRTS